MSIPEQYDAIIIGSGEAGKYMSWTLGAQEQRVINVEDTDRVVAAVKLVEKEENGGTPTSEENTVH